jgi:hypothetical protein
MGLTYSSVMGAKPEKMFDWHARPLGCQRVGIRCELMYFVRFSGYEAAMRLAVAGQAGKCRRADGVDRGIRTNEHDARRECRRPGGR